MESKTLLRLIRYHWAVIVVCAVLGVLGGIGLALTAQPQYTARAEVNVSVVGGSSTGEVAQSTNYSQQQARNFSAIATREIVLQPVIDDLDLDMSVAHLRTMVSTTVPLNTTIIAISVTESSPEQAAEIANSLASNLAKVVPDLTPQVDDRSTVRMETIETAVPPSYPSAPSKKLYAFMGLLGGLVVATAIVVVRGIVNAKVRTKDQITEITGATVIGSISQNRSAARNPMALASDAQSMRAEEYRQLRANLRFLQVGADHKVFVVTSSIPSEGKTSTAANLGAALAASGQSVCMVEADLRRPTLGDVLDLPESVGLTSVLMHEEALEDTLLTWGPDGMKVLLAGDIPPNPSELLESDELVGVIDELKRTFDIVIVDSPPLNPVADASVLARRFGGVILVVGARRVRAHELRRAAENLNAVGASIEGAVLNLASNFEVGTYRHGYAPRPRKQPTPRHATPRQVAPVTPAPEATAEVPADTVPPEELLELAPEAPESEHETDLGDELMSRPGEDEPDERAIPTSETTDDVAALVDFDDIDGDGELAGDEAAVARKGRA